MQGTFGERLAEALTVLVTFSAVALCLALLVGSLARSRDQLSIGWPIGTALVLRVVAAGGVSLTGFGSSLRGGDELAFLFGADKIAATPFGSEAWTDALAGELHIVILAAQQAVLDSPDLALRATEAGIAVAGIALLAAAVYELAGARAATVAAWLLALEPTSVFFSTLIHKESLMMLAIGLVALGGVRVWKRGELGGFVPIVAGCALAASTRGYVSWFLIAAAAAITLHAGLRAAREGMARSLVLLSLVVLLGAVTLPIVFGDFADQNLRQLDVSQRAYASDDTNLQLEAVDFSTGQGILTNLPRRIRDVVLRPYPWQLDNTSQQLGLLGTLVVLVGLVVLLRQLLRNRGEIMNRAGPFIYIGVTLLIAYSLAAGNAGTAFRYRTQIVAVGICVVTALALGERARSRVELREPLTLPRPGLAA